MAPKINLKDKVEDGEIDLSMSDLQDVPVREIAQVTKAHSLDLSNNHLTLLPKNFTILTNLIKLDLSKNQLKELPDSFGNLVKLKHLDLYKNQLQHLPLSFSKLKALRWLDLKDNPLVPAVKEVAGPCLDLKQCQKCAKDIVSFYSNLEEKVIVEREARDKQRQRDKLANENNQKQKQQEKKAKKKDKPKKEAFSNQEVPVEETLKQEKIESSEPTKQKSFFGTFAKLVLTLTALSFCVLFVLTSIKWKHTENVSKQTVELWVKYLEVTPDYLKEPSHKVAFYFQSLHDFTGNTVLAFTKYLFDLRENENVKKIVDNIHSAFNSTFDGVKTYYKSIFAKT